MYKEKKNWRINLVLRIHPSLTSSKTLSKHYNKLSWLENSLKSRRGRLRSSYFDLFHHLKNLKSRKRTHWVEIVASSSLDTCNELTHVSSKMVFRRDLRCRADRRVSDKTEERFFRFGEPFAVRSRVQLAD